VWHFCPCVSSEDKCTIPPGAGMVQTRPGRPGQDKPAFSVLGTSDPCSSFCARTHPLWPPNLRAAMRRLSLAAANAEASEGGEPRPREPRAEKTERIRAGLARRGARPSQTPTAIGGLCIADPIHSRP
jgi:hypothetical protein